jgi:type II secretory pathway pseudopilin PulG
VQTRAKAEDGFGLIELVIAMTVLNIGILAIVAAFNSGAVSLTRANNISNATAIADKKMELYRGMRNCAIYMTATSGVSSWANESGLGTATQIIASSSLAAYPPLTSPSNCTVIPPSVAAGDPDPLLAHQQVTAANGKLFWVDTYIMTSLVSTSNYVKLVTVIVRDPTDTANLRALVRESSTFSSYAALDTG